MLITIPQVVRHPKRPSLATTAGVRDVTKESEDTVRRAATCKLTVATEIADFVQMIQDFFET
jgi:hypothetical protein